MTAPWDAFSKRDLVDNLAEGGSKSLTWAGRFCWKNPLDLVIYQEIVFEVRPTLVVETGTNAGGSAIFWRDMMRLAETCAHPRVVTIDVDPLPSSLGNMPTDINFLTGSSTNAGIVEHVRREIDRDDVVLVNLDSDHAYLHVTNELNAYADMVTPGSYLIVEDGIDDYRFNRYGPRQATIDWLADGTVTARDFAVDKHRERLGITNCPDGFLKRGQ